MSLPRLTLVDQTVAHLREGFLEGRWSGVLPGEVLLSKELDVSPQTLRAALRQLEDEGLLLSHGRGRPRTITESVGSRKQLRVGLLVHDAPINGLFYQDHLASQIKANLEAAGHLPFYSAKSQAELHHSVPLIKAMVVKQPADVWIISGGSRAVLEWFSLQPLPCLALYGRTGGLKIARTGPDHVPAILSATRELIALGHRRIVLINLKTRRNPTHGKVERAFLHEMAAHKIPTGDYNMPDWKETPEGFSALLESLFHSTPPTALIIDEQTRLLATMQFLLRVGIQVPKQVSLVASDEQSLDWCHPGFAHLTWDNAPIIRRVVRWVAAVGRGRGDCKTINYPAKFISGGSIGAAPQPENQAFIRP